MRGAGANRGFTDPAAAIAGGGYNLSLPDAPGAPTRGTVSEDQFREYLRQAHETAGEAVRRAYMQGGMDMHGYYQQTDRPVPTGQPGALGPVIRGTPAQGSGTLPVRPVTMPLTNATVGETPAARMSPQTYAANVPAPRSSATRGSGGLTRAEFEGLLRESRSGLNAHQASQRTYWGGAPPG